jgi:NTE family protein
MKIGLALSGGGVLGVAHLGVLKLIEKEKIQMNYISGTSAGAIIGALFAAGGVAKVEAFLDDLKNQGLFSRANLIFGGLPDKTFETIRTTLQKHLPNKFYDLNINFVCVATHFAEGSPVYLESGDLVDALMASSAFPGAFPAQDIDGKSLIDGGISRNLPAGILRKKGVDFVIGSSLYNIKVMDKFDVEGNEPGRLLSTLRSIDIMQKELARYEMKKCDYVFTPPVETFSWFHFSKMADIRAIGEEYANANSAEFLKELKRHHKEKGFLSALFARK